MTDLSLTPDSDWQLQYIDGERGFPIGPIVK